MHTTQYPDLFVTDPEGFNMNTGKKNPTVVDQKPLLTENSMSSAAVFDSVKKTNITIFD